MLQVISTASGSPSIFHTSHLLSYSRVFSLSLSLSPGRILVEVAADPPEIELETCLRMRAAASLDGVDVVGKVVAEDGGPL